MFLLEEEIERGFHGANAGGGGGSTQRMLG